MNNITRSSLQNQIDAVILILNKLPETGYLSVVYQTDIMQTKHDFLPATAHKIYKTKNVCYHVTPDKKVRHK